MDIEHFPTHVLFTNSGKIDDRFPAFCFLSLTCQNLKVENLDALYTDGIWFCISLAVLSLVLTGICVSLMHPD